MFNRTLPFGMLLASLAMPQAVPAQSKIAEPSPFMQSISASLAAKDYDEAIRIIRSDDAPPEGKPFAMLRVAQTRFHANQNRESWALLKEIVTAYPDHEVTSSAWLTLADLHTKLKDEKSMVAALERSLSIHEKREEAGLRDLNGESSGSSARERLGKHYFDNGQSELAISVYAKWRPDSGCGNCNASMLRRRLVSMVLCQARLNRHADAAETAWQEGEDAVALFVLVRLYSEAGQLPDLAQMLKNRPERVRSKYRPAPPIEAAIALAKSDNWADHLAQFETVEGRNAGDEHLSVAEHVTMWRLIGNAKTTTPLIVVAAQQNPQSYYAKMLAAIDTPESRTSLVDLAVCGDVHEQQYICAIIRMRVPKPDKLLTEVLDRVPDDRKFISNFSATSSPFAQRLYRPWPMVEPGSLPRDLVSPKE